MRRTPNTKSETRNPTLNNKSPISLSDNEMMSFNLFTSSTSSSSSSSNLSPLAAPFTVERSNNNNKFNLGTNFDSHFNLNNNSDGLGFWSSSPNFQSPVTSHGLSADSITTATVPVTYSTFPNPNPNPNPITITSPSTHNWSSSPAGIDASFTTFSSTFATSSGHNWSTVPAVSVSAIGPNQHVIDAYFSSGLDAPTAHNWSSMNSSVKSGLEHVDPPAGHVFGVNTNAQSRKWSLGDDGSVYNVAPMMPGDYSLLPSGSFHQDYGSSQAGYSESLSGSMYSGQADGARGKEGFYSFGAATRENNVGPSIIGASHEQLDNHNPGEDSPCWKGAPTHFSSNGSQEEESSQHPMKKLQNYSASGEDVLLHMDQSLHGTVKNVANAVTSESLEVNTVVKALNNLSELLLRLYSKDECRLKEQDQKALDHVIANLNVCMSSRVQQVDPAQKCSLPQQITSNELRECLHQERNNDQYGKNIEELQSAYVRDEGLPKDYNMVQKIKRVLDEDLEFKEDLPSEPLLYKNLWLEAEAELCVSSYKGRLHRAKRDMAKSKASDVSEVASDIKKISSSGFSPTAPRMLHEAAGRQTLNTHAPNNSLPIVDDIDDVDNSVMTRFNILKRREESNPVSMAVKEPADVETYGNNNHSSGVAEDPHLKHLLDTDNTAVMHSHGYQKMQGPFATADVDHAVMARLSVLKSRGEPDPDDAQVSEEGVGTSMMQNQFGSLSAYNAASFGWEYVMK